MHFGTLWLQANNCYGSSVREDARFRRSNITLGDRRESTANFLPHVPIIRAVVKSKDIYCSFIVAALKERLKLNLMFRAL